MWLGQGEAVRGDADAAVIIVYGPQAVEAASAEDTIPLSVTENPVGGSPGRCELYAWGMFLVAAVLIVRFWTKRRK